MRKNAVKKSVKSVDDWNTLRKPFLSFQVCPNGQKDLALGHILPCPCVDSSWAGHCSPGFAQLGTPSLAWSSVVCVTEYSSMSRLSLWETSSRKILAREEEETWNCSMLWCLSLWTLPGKLPWKNCSTGPRSGSKSSFGDLIFIVTM